MSGSKIILHNGVEIIFNDYSGLKTVDEVKNVVNQAAKIIQNKKPNSVLSLICFKNTHFNKQIISALQDAAKDNKPYIKASAVFGVSGMGKIILDGVIKLTGRDLPTFNSEEAAKEYLVLK
ncbi:MAG: hypothetical protein ABFS35_23715 [Bacteroidota bacterium]